MEDKPSGYLSLSKGMRNRPVCFSPARPASQVRKLEEAMHADAMTMNWEPFHGYAFPPFNLTPIVLNKVTKDKAAIILIAPLWQAQPWWPLLLSLPSGRATSPHPNHQTLFEGSIRPSKDSTNVSQTAPSRVSHLRKQYQAMGISEDVTQILLSASRPSTRKMYRSSWGRWSCWSDKRKVDPFSASLAGILLYLTEKERLTAQLMLRVQLFPPPSPKWMVTLWGSILSLPSY